MEEIFYFFQFFIKLTKRSKLMKKFTLFSILSVLLYSAPGHAGPKKGGKKRFGARVEQVTKGEEERERRAAEKEAAELATAPGLSLSTDAYELSGVLARIIRSNNPKITDEADKVWKLVDMDEALDGIPITLMRDIEITEGGDPSSVDVGGTITFKLRTPQDETRSQEAIRYLHFTRLR